MRNRDDFDEELQAQLRGMAVPEPDDTLEQRILAAAFAEASQREAPVIVHHGIGFQVWWDGIKRQHGGKLAVAAAVAAVALLILNPFEAYMGQPTAVQLASQQAASEPQVATTAPAASSAEDRYTVDGVPLLEDIDMANIDIDDDDFASF